MMQFDVRTRTTSAARAEDVASINIVSDTVEIYVLDGETNTTAFHFGTPEVPHQTVYLPGTRFKMEARER